MVNVFINIHIQGQYKSDKRIHIRKMYLPRKDLLKIPSCLVNTFQMVRSLLSLKEQSLSNSEHSWDWYFVPVSITSIQTVQGISL